MHFNNISMSLSNIIKFNMIYLQATQWENEKLQKPTKKYEFYILTMLFYYDYMQISTYFL